jgi:TonB-dependent SusC/RagA subfamily outer membrane receptor
MKSRLITLIIIGGSFLMLSAGLAFIPPAIIPDLEGKIEDYYKRYPQQKVYLHLNKQAYHAGDKLWYKAYLVDARTHKPDSISKNLLVEIVNSFGNTSMIQIAKIENGFARGDFHIPDTLPEGLYQVRAYTNWMRNFGSDYFFKRDINIWNPDYFMNSYREDKLARKKQKRKSTRKAQKLDLQFFPEGGYLVAGHNTKVGFKALNELGIGIEVSGTIFEGRNKQVVDFRSSDLGMGAVSFTPESGKDYTAEVILEDGKKDRFKLPEVQSEGYSLKLLDNNRDGIKLQIGSTYQDPTVLIACHTRGKLLHLSEVKLGAADRILDIPTGDYPAGILHITLFDSQRKPRCERLAFIHSDDDLVNLYIRQDKQVYGITEKVELTLVARDNDGRPLEGEFSISVADRDLPNEASDFQSNIISNFLLASDIAGRIERPDYYFRDRNAETLEALDHLLLTQGWRRFDWDDLVSQTRREINYPIQKGLVVRGTITRSFLDIPLKNIPVTLTVLSEFNDVFITRSDAQGQYNFELPDYEDTIQVEITARRLNGKKNLVIYIEDNDLEDTEEIFSTYSSEMMVRGTNILKPIPEPEEDTMQQDLEGIYHSPDYVLYVDENLQNYNTVLEMIQGRIPGVVVSGNSVQIRGPSSFYGSNEPLFLIDNVPADLSSVQALNPNDIERIEVLKGPSAAIYGVRGGNGVIAIFTRRGRFMIRGKLTFDMLGYHRPSEFYSPVYGTDFDEFIVDDRTSIYWNPVLKTDNNGMAKISFFTTKKKSTFHIVAEGLSPEGKLGRAEKSYEVK